jgi:nucleoside-diphosphate-sugar epimerase
MAVSDLALPSIMITGAGGLLGVHVLSRLAAAVGVSRVVVASRSKPVPATHADNGPAWHVLDLVDPGLFVPPGVDMVVHVAGEKRDGAKMEAVNHHGTRRLVEACARANVRRFVHVSSVGVYGAEPSVGRVDESQPHRPRNAYETSKEAGERAVRALCPRLGLEYVVVQPSNVIGHLPGRAYPLLGLMSSIKSRRFAYFGEQETCVNYVCVEDTAAAIVVAGQDGLNGKTYIVNTPTRLTNLVGWLSAELGIDAPIRRLPLWFGAAVARSGSVLQKISGRALPINAERFQELTNTVEYDGGAIERELGLTYPVGVEAAVRALVRAYRAEGRV